MNGDSEVNKIEAATPPSQGKVEISEDGIYWTCKCGWRSTFLDLKCPGCENGRPAIYAVITQALTESSGQGTDGACCERMREAAARVCDKRAEAFDDVISTLSYPTHKLRAEGKASGSRSCANSIRALPLPVSADGSVIQTALREIQRIAADGIEANDESSDNWNLFADIHQHVCSAVALKSKQPSDTGAGK